MRITPYLHPILPRWCIFNEEHHRWECTYEVIGHLHRIYTHVYLDDAFSSRNTTSDSIFHQIRSVLTPIIAPMRKSFFMRVRFGQVIPDFILILHNFSLVIFWRSFSKFPISFSSIYYIEISWVFLKFIWIFPNLEVFSYFWWIFTNFLKLS